MMYYLKSCNSENILLFAFLHNTSIRKKLIQKRQIEQKEKEKDRKERKEGYYDPQRIGLIYITQ